MGCSTCGAELVEDIEAKSVYKKMCPNCGVICKTEEDHEWHWWSRHTFQCTKCFCLGSYEGGYIVEES